MREREPLEHACRADDTIQASDHDAALPHADNPTPDPCYQEALPSLAENTMPMADDQAGASAADASYEATNAETLGSTNQAAEEETPTLEQSPEAHTAEDESGTMSTLDTQADALLDAPIKLHSRKKTSRRRRLLLVVLLLLVLAALASGGLAAYLDLHATYQQDFSLADAGEQQLHSALDTIQTLPAQGLNVRLVAQASQEFTNALHDFAQVNSSLHAFPSFSTSIPVYGSRLAAALHVLPLAITASQAGQQACALLQTALTSLQNPLNTHSQGLTAADIQTLDYEFMQLTRLLQQATSEVQRLQPADLQLDPRLSKLVGTFHTALPQIQTWISQANSLLPILPVLLGVGQPTHYLVEVLDTTELRPGGGFIGNYGLITVDGGRVTDASITDSYLLDNAFTGSGHTIAFPSGYQWFDIAPSWSLRDSNLEADFPTDARYAEQLYKEEGGSAAVQGVVAITPAFISAILNITGPITVPEYHETVTAQNLIDRIHYYQLGPGRTGQDTPSPDGESSVRKHFTALLAQDLLARVRQLPSSDFADLARVLLKSLQSKDVQLYLNAQPAESLLNTYSVADAIEQPTNDGLLVVDANIGVTKANAFITNTLDDQVTIDQDGNATHHTTLTYTWAVNGDVYGSSTYRDYVRVYTPPNSVLLSQSGWEDRGNGTAFANHVWNGYFTLTYGQTVTIHLVWTTPQAAQKNAHGWTYAYLLQRQAGANWQATLRLSLPATTAITQVQGNSLLQTSTLTRPSLSSLLLHQSLNGNTSLQVDYHTV
jgi:hypothetical protein